MNGKINNKSGHKLNRQNKEAVAYLAVVVGFCGTISHFALNRFLCVVITGERLTFWLVRDNNDEG